MPASRTTLAIIALAAALGGCAVQHPVQQAQVYSDARHASGMQLGSVQSIDTIRAQSQTSGGGALVGAAAGGLIGNQFEHGNKRAGLTLIGVLAGALVGNEIEKNQRGARDFYRVAIRLDDGAVRAFDYQSLGDIRVGDRVRVENNQVYRY